MKTDCGHLDRLTVITKVEKVTTESKEKSIGVPVVKCRKHYLLLKLLISKITPSKTKLSSLQAHLSNGSCQHADNLFMRYRNNTLAVYFNYSMTNTHTTSFSYSASQETANLHVITLKKSLLRLTSIISR